MQRDLAYCVDILLAAEKIVGYTHGLTYERFSLDDLTQDAVIRQITVIGEAARRISKSFQQEHANIEWSDIIGMRHRLIHDYDRIDLQQVWMVATADLPKLIEQVEPLIPPADRPE